MKKQNVLAIAFFYFLGICPIFAQNPSKVIDSKLDKVTVFLNGASLTRSAKTNIAVGKSELIIKNLSAQIDKQSIQLKAEGKFTVLSVNQQSRFLNESDKQEKLTLIQNKKTEIEEKIKAENAMLNVFKQEEIMLSKNQEINTRTSTAKVSDLKEAVDFHRARLSEVLMKQLEIRRNISKLDNETKKLNTQLTSENVSQEVSTSEIIITVQAKENTTGSFNLSYFVANAGWTPSYDLRVQDITQPIELAYKANVYQYSGEDWKDVKLTLSTANPNQSGVAPSLQNWILGYRNDYSAYYAGQSSPNNQSITQVYGLVKSNEDDKGMPGVSVQLKDLNFGVMTDANGYYTLTIPPNLQQHQKVMVFSSVGFASQTVAINNSRQDITLHQDSHALQEVVVTGYGSQLRREVTGSVTQMQKSRSRSSNADEDGFSQKSLSLDIEEADSPTSKSFEIQLPYTVLSDGKVYAVEIKIEEITARYEYFCVPKIDKDVFLTAKILNWEQYNLLPGEASLYFEGTYLGKSALNLDNKDTLSISLGRDKSISVSRVLQKNFTEKQFIGSSKTERRAYTISVRNTRKQSINLIVEDQFPISKFKEVEILEKEAQEAQINDETGRITWNMSLEPNKEKKFLLKYAVKSPKKSSFEAD
jgi:hypothetical protein